ncbi:flagellar hook-length control protein FliK [Paucisalibacillus globulus]|uniref:flagellar hook-length control protein FliK n=1 Tax=Paucisalibacillus globulus TaxID=351095 RepID=UPI0003FF4738|nr:flagellar hook-length control protein FliK [Paucisalibacillus globulus]
MNTIGMFVQTMATVAGITSMKHDIKTGEANLVFSQLLQQLGIEPSELLQGNSGEINNLLEIVANTEDETVDTEVPSFNQAESNLEQLLFEGLLLNPELQQVLQPLLDNRQVEYKTLDNMKQQLADIFTKFNNLLSEIKNVDEVRKVAPKILELLKQWTAVENQIVRTTGLQEGETEATNLKVNQVWKEILLTYQNRNKLTTKQLYQSESQVTSRDVVKWIENALQNQQVNINNTAQVQGVDFQSNMSLPKLEQYVIFINQNQGGQAVESKLIEQFQQVVKTSKFLSMPNGVNQMSIALRPENLGEMMVRLIEINGEMTVKIVVSSQAAKEMLESNINQLRHMFSPQQVVIERQDLGAGQGQSQTKESDEQSLYNQDQNQSQSDESGHHEQKHNENDFEAHLDELLQSVKV